MLLTDRPGVKEIHVNLSYPRTFLLLQTYRHSYLEKLTIETRLLIVRQQK